MMMKDRYFCTFTTRILWAVRTFPPHVIKFLQLNQNSQYAQRYPCIVDTMSWSFPYPWWPCCFPVQDHRSRSTSTSVSSLLFDLRCRYKCTYSFLFHQDIQFNLCFDLLCNLWFSCVSVSYSSFYCMEGICQIKKIQVNQYRYNKTIKTTF